MAKDRVHKVAPVIEKLGVPIGVFNFDLTSAGVFRYDLDLPETSPQDSVAYDSTAESEVMSVGAGQPRLNVDVEDSETEEEEPEEEEEEEEEEDEEESKETYPFTGPKCGYKTMPVNSVHKANCFRDFKLDQAKAFDSAHIDYAYSFYFREDWCSAVTAQSGTNLYYSVQAAAHAVRKLKSKKMRRCFCSKDKIRPPRKKEEKDKSKKSDEDDTDNVGRRLVGGPLFIGQGETHLTPMGSSTVGNLSGLAFFLTVAGEYKLLRLTINDEVVYDPHAEGGAYLHPKLVENNTTIEIHNGGDSQPVPELLFDIFGDRTPAYRDWTLLTVRDFPKDFDASGEYVFRAEITDVWEDDAVEENTWSVSPSRYTVDSNSKAVYAQNDTNEIDLYGERTASFDRNILPALSGVADMRSSYSSNLMLYYQSGTEHIIRTYKDYFFDDFFEHTVPGRPLAMEAAYVNVGLQMAIGYGNQLDLVWNGLLERTFSFRGTVHSIFCSGTFYYVFTDSSIYKIDGEVHIVRNRWDIPSSHVVPDQYGAGHTIFDQRSGVWRNVTLRGGSQHTDNWKTATPWKPTGKIRSDIGTTGPQYLYISGDRLVSLHVRDGRISTNHTLTNVIAGDVAQYYNPDNQKIIAKNDSGELFEVVAKEQTRDTVSLKRLLTGVFVDGPEMIIDVDEVPGLYGYVYFGDPDEIISLFQFFGLRAYADGDATIITNKPGPTLSVPPEMISSHESHLPQTELLTKVTLEYRRPDEYGTASRADAVLPVSASDVNYGVTRKYTTGVYAHDEAMRLLARGLLYSRRPATSEHVVKCSRTNMQIIPGDLIEGLGVVRKVTQSAEGTVLDVIGHVGGNALVYDYGDPEDYSADVPSMGAKLTDTSRATRPYIIQCSAIDREDGAFDDLVYLSAVTLLQSAASQAGLVFESDQLTPSTFPDEPIRYGTLDTSTGTNSGCGRPFTTDYNSEFVIDFAQAMSDRLSSATYDELLESETRNMMLIGDELIQFMGVEFLDAEHKKVRLYNGLFRGRRGTDIAINTHAQGERVFYMDSSAITVAPVSTSALIAQRGISVKVSTEETSDLYADRTRAAQAVYEGINVKPWKPVSPHFLFNDFDPIAMWFPRYRHQVHFLNNFSDIVQPAVEYFRINNGFGNAPGGFARSVIPELYILRGPYDQARLQAAINSEQYPRLDIIGTVAPPTNYIVRHLPLSRDFTMMELDPEALTSDGITMENVTDFHFAVTVTDEVNDGATLGFSLLSTDVDGDHPVAARCVEGA